MKNTWLSAHRNTFPALNRSFRSNRQTLAAAIAAVTDEPPPKKHTPNPSRDFAALELLTEDFRRDIAKKHANRIAEETKRERLAVEEWTDVASGEVPPAPCKNMLWKRGAKRPPPRRVRCGDTHDAYGRCALLVGHEGDHRASRFRVKCPCCVCVLHDTANARQWHDGRRAGQRERFDRVRSCGTRTLIASCGVCGLDRKAIPEGCGVRRVCDRCEIANAVKRRARFGRARARAFVHGHRYGLTRRVRPGGRYSEKMLTVTVPHILLKDATGELAKTASNALDARIFALFLAWPRFLRRLNAHWKTKRSEHVDYHRAFEWTPGKSDAHGHPHFHVYLWSTFVDDRDLEDWWADALREVGCPVAEYDDGRPVISVHICELKSWDLRAARELIKGGDYKKALTFSRLDFRNPADGERFRRGAYAGPGVDAFKYSEGWTLGDVKNCSSEVRADLYKALEGRRLTQASRGFFGEDPHAACEFCNTEGHFRVRVDVPSIPLPRDAAGVPLVAALPPSTAPPN